MGPPAVGIRPGHGAMVSATGEPPAGAEKGRERMLVNGAVITGKGAAVKGRTPEEIEQIRVILRGRFDDLNSEYEDAVAENHQLRLAEIGDAAGDDQADSGSKTAERDAATSLLRTLLDRRSQAELAMQRLEDGSYGNCEGCHNPIPVVIPIMTMRSNWATSQCRRLNAIASIAWPTRGRLRGGSRWKRPAL